jgi:hypothetical protein
MVSAALRREAVVDSTFISDRGAETGKVVVLVHEPDRQLVRVEIHLPGAFTRVVFFAIAHGDIRIDIPTDCIPEHLRPIGSEFVLVRPQFTIEPGDSEDAIRAMTRRYRVEDRPR